METEESAGASMSGISFESRFERRVNPSLSEYMRSMEIKEKENSSPRPTTLSLRRKEERPVSRSLSPRPTSPKKKSGGKKSVTFQDEVRDRRPRPERREGRLLVVGELASPPSRRSPPPDSKTLARRKKDANFETLIPSFRS